MQSQKWRLNANEAKAVLKNALIFTAPVILVCLQILEQGGTAEKMFIAVKVWVLGVLIDFFRKLSAGK